MLGGPLTICRFGGTIQLVVGILEHQIDCEFRMLLPNVKMFCAISGFPQTFGFDIDVSFGDRPPLWWGWRLPIFIFFSKDIKKLAIQMHSILIRIDGSARLIHIPFVIQIIYYFSRCNWTHSMQTSENIVSTITSEHTAPETTKSLQRADSNEFILPPIVMITRNLLQVFVD